MKTNECPPKLKAVIDCFISKGITDPEKLCVLPYLVDVLAVRHLGKPITEGTHIAISFDDNLFSEEVREHMNNLEKENRC